MTAYRVQIRDVPERGTDFSYLSVAILHKAELEADFPECDFEIVTVNRTLDTNPKAVL